MPLTIDLASELAEWPDVHFELAASKSPSEGDREQFDQLLSGWYLVGFYGGYGPATLGRGVLHNMTEPSYTKDDQGFSAKWRVDMGSVPDHALDVMIRALEGWSERSLPGAKLTVR